MDIMTDSITDNNTSSAQREEWQTQFFKTKLCPYHLGGRCINGTRCRFAHTANELRPLPDLHRTKLCESYVKKEICNNITCPFAHNPCELRTSSHSFYKVTLCNFYKKKRCWNGIHCRFAHGITELHLTQLLSPTTTSSSHQLNRSGRHNNDTEDESGANPFNLSTPDYYEKQTEDNYFCSNDQDNYETENKTMFAENMFINDDKQSKNINLLPKTEENQFEYHPYQQKNHESTEDFKQQQMQLMKNNFSSGAGYFNTIDDYENHRSFNTRHSDQCELTPKKLVNSSVGSTKDNCKSRLEKMTTLKDLYETPTDLYEEGQLLSLSSSLISSPHCSKKEIAQNKKIDFSLSTNNDICSKATDLIDSFSKNSKTVSLAKKHVPFVTASYMNPHVGNDSFLHYNENLSKYNKKCMTKSTDGKQFLPRLTNSTDSSPEIIFPNRNTNHLNLFKVNIINTIVQDKNALPINSLKTNKKSLKKDQIDSHRTDETPTKCNSLTTPTSILNKDTFNNYITQIEKVYDQTICLQPTDKCAKSDRHISIDNSSEANMTPLQENMYRHLQDYKLIKQSEKQQHEHYQSEHSALYPDSSNTSVTNSSWLSNVFTENISGTINNDIERLTNTEINISNTNSDDQPDKIDLNLSSLDNPNNLNSICGSNNIIYSKKTKDKHLSNTLLDYVSQPINSDKGLEADQYTASHNVYNNKSIINKNNYNNNDIINNNTNTNSSITTNNNVSNNDDYNDHDCNEEQYYEINENHNKANQDKNNKRCYNNIILACSENSTQVSQKTLGLSENKYTPNTQCKTESSLSLLPSLTNLMKTKSVIQPEINQESSNYMNKSLQKNEYHDIARQSFLFTQNHDHTDSKPYTLFKEDNKASSIKKPSSTKPSVCDMANSKSLDQSSFQYLLPNEHPSLDSSTSFDLSNTTNYLFDQYLMCCTPDSFLSTTTESSNHTIKKNDSKLNEKLHLKAFPIYKQSEVHPFIKKDTSYYIEN